MLVITTTIPSSFLPYLLLTHTDSPQARAQNWPTSVLPPVLFITTLGCSSLSITRHKNTPLFAVYMCYPFPLTFARQRDESGSHELSGHYFLRSRYSPLAVSTEITSPVLIKAGTFTTRPVSSVASLSTLLVVSPFTTSSV